MKNPLGRYTIQEAKKAGYTVDRTCYPHVGYKGARFAPTDLVSVYTEVEEKLITALIDKGNLNRRRVEVDILNFSEGG